MLDRQQTYKQIKKPS